ncbi:MAG: hypothetical protein K5750_02260 [Eubacterium sp.]|nr:hypothetical protein [Eubacterium sp.]
MEDNTKNTTKIKLLDGGLHYFFPILMILLLPIPIKPLADKWGYTHYSSMSTLLQGIMLTVLWPLSLILFNIYANKMKKKGVFTVFNGTDDMISTKSLIAASVIFITMIVLVTFKIGFKVKPFYDFGEKLVGYDVANNIGKLLIKITKCAFIPLICRGAYILSGCAGADRTAAVANTSEADKTVSDKTAAVANTSGTDKTGSDKTGGSNSDKTGKSDALGKSILRYIIYFILVLAFGVFDILNFSEKLVVIYCIFYISFAALFLLMKKNYWKAYVMSLLIYLL